MQPTHMHPRGFLPHRAARGHRHYRHPHRAALCRPCRKCARPPTAFACGNNLKQLSLACHSYEATNGSLPYGRKYDLSDTYNWSELVLPYIEQDAVFRLYTTLPQTPFVASIPGPNGPIGDDPNLRTARQTVIKTFLCPSDQGPMQNEISTTAYGLIRGNYRACTGSGDMYGNATDGTSGPWGAGVFATRPGQSVDPGRPFAPAA